MTYNVQFLNKAYQWVNLMSDYRCEQSAIRYAEVRARQIADKIRVICNRGSVIYMCNQRGVMDLKSYNLCKEHYKPGTMVKFKNPFYPVDHWLGWIDSATYNPKNHQDCQWDLTVTWDTGKGLPRTMTHYGWELLTEHEDGFEEEQ